MMPRRFAFPLLAALLPAGAAAVGFDAARATNQLGLDLFRQLSSASPRDNLVVSPYSIASALALAYAGADGFTRDELARVLHLPPDDASLQTGFANLRTALSELADRSRDLARSRSGQGARTDPIEWHAANRLFGQQGHAFREPFLKLMEEGFGAPFEALDFRRHPERERAAINAWVEEQTRNRIRDLIPSGALGDTTRLVLVNALYLKAPWEKPFEAHATRPRAFRPASGASYHVPMMQQTARLGHAWEDALTVVTLDYLGSGLQFLILLPEGDATTDTIARRLTPEDFARWARLGERSRPDVALTWPKFKVEGATLRLGGALRALGVRTAFDDPPASANFARIAPRRPDDYLALSDVFHRTFIAVDEQGTEAAAATAVSMVTLVAAAPPPKPIEVRVDRPFLFAIQHRASGACLFFGRISDPR